jgi:predicted nucleic acid-binding protein
MAIVLFDSNILIDHILGYREATLELAAYDDAVISAVSWMEVTCKLSVEARNEFDVHLLLGGIKVVHTNDAIMRRTAELRGLTWKKLPDCIIRATAEMEGRIVVTRNPVDFGGHSNSLVRIPYEIKGGKVVSITPPLP